MTVSELKQTIKSRGVYQWEVAEYLGVSEATFTRIMRHPNEEKTLEILSAVDQIAAHKIRAKISGAEPIVVNK